MNLLKNTETMSQEELASLSILMSDFLASLASVQPSAKREGFATVPDVTWEDVGALQDIREELTMAILVNSKKVSKRKRFWGLRHSFYSLMT